MPELQLPWHRHPHALAAGHGPPGLRQVPSHHHLGNQVTVIGETTVVLITGARCHPDTVSVTSALAKYVLTEAPGWVIVRHGACPGEDSVDQAVHEWIADCGDALGIIEDAMPADWDHCTADCQPNHRIRKQLGDIYHPGKSLSYCPSAGPRRNASMILKDPVPDLVISAPYKGSRGTRNCTRLAREAHIPIRHIVTPKIAVPQGALFR